MPGIPLEEYIAMWKLAGQFIDAAFDSPYSPYDKPSREGGRVEPLAGASNDPSRSVESTPRTDGG